METDGIIVVLEDDPTTRSLFKRTLDSSGYRVFLANKWEEARLLIEYLRPNLLISDCLLPTFNGVEIGQALRKRFSKKELPLLLATSFFQRPKDEIDAIENSGANGLLRKPVKPKELKQAVEELIGQPRCPQNPEELASVSSYHETSKKILSLLQEFHRSAGTTIKEFSKGEEVLPEVWIRRFGSFLYPAISPHDEQHVRKCLRDIVCQAFTLNGIPQLTLVVEDSQMGEVEEHSLDIFED